MSEKPNFQWRYASVSIPLSAEAAENVRRTRLRAGGLQLAVRDLACLRLRLNLQRLRVWDVQLRE